MDGHLEVLDFELEEPRGDLRIVRILGAAAPDAGRRSGSAEPAGHSRAPIRRKPGHRRKIESRTVLSIVFELQGEPCLRAEQHRLVAGAGGDSPRLQHLAFRDDVRAVKDMRVLGDYVDDAEHRVRSVEHRARPEDDLDVVDELHRNAGAAFETGGSVERFVDDMSVDEQKDVVALVSAQEHAPRADVRCPHGARRHDTERKEIDRLVDRVDPIKAEVLGRDGR